MGILMFFDVIHNEIYGSSSYTNWWWEILKVLIPVIVAIGTIFLVKWVEKKREHRKQRLKLFNVVQLSKKMIVVYDTIDKTFVKHAEEIKADSFFETRMLNQSITDFRRALDINKDDVFAAFIARYSDNLKASDDYRRLYYSIEFYNNIYEESYKKYEQFRKAIYDSRVELRASIFSVKVSLMEILLEFENASPNNKDLPSYKELKELFDKYGEEENKLNDVPFEFMVNGLLVPLNGITSKYLDNKDILKLHILNAKTRNIREFIIHDTLQLADFLLRSTKGMKASVDGLKRAVGSIEKQFPEFAKQPTNFKQRFNDWLEI